MKKILIASCLIVALTACVKNEYNVAAQPPIISFYKGIDPWTKQPRFIYRDTTINGIKSRMTRVHFAASGGIKHMLVTRNGEVLLDKVEDNETRFNEEFDVSIDPVSAPSSFALHFELLDYEGKSAERDLMVQFK